MSCAKKEGVRQQHGTSECSEFHTSESSDTGQCSLLDLTFSINGSGYPLHETKRKKGQCCMNDVSISMATVRMFKRIMRPIAEEGIIPLAEYNEAISQLTSLAEHGTLNQ